MVKIAVIGGGIIGLSSALRILREFRDIEVKVISEKFSPNTTGDGSAGLWGPFILGTTPEHLIEHGHIFTTFVCEPTKYLPWLLREFRKLGGQVDTRRVGRMEDVAEFDCVVNCTGVEAHHFVPDPSVGPVRGQVTRVVAPNIFTAILDDSDDGNYVIPNQESVVLGGTHQHSWNLTIDKNDSAFIKNGCEKLIPSLKTSKQLYEWVGLRPGRPSIRTEKEIKMRPGKKTQIIIHNYGHGGSGVTLSWGSAGEVVELLRESLHVLSLHSSKL